MIIALNKERQRIHIENADSGMECFCPCCGERLVQHKGQIRRHHFAHYPGSACSDSWEGQYDMSDWHLDWQNRFPKGNQEVLLALGEIRHRADVLIGRTVVEFQRSNLSAKAFQDRNSFYTNLGYKVIWVFDLTERFATGDLRCEGDEKTFHWTKPNNAFNTFHLRTGQTELFFQVRDQEEQCLVKVSGIPGRGLELFTVSKWYSKEEFLSYLGIRDGVCAPPVYDDLAENGEYRAFCEQYGIRLNRQQERAVQAVEGANLLLAVPGSGKTTVLVARLGYMILCKKILPQRILAMTFSKQAAKDMRSRFRTVFGSELGEQVQFRTIHSVANGILSTYERRSGHRKPELESDTGKLVADILRTRGNDYPSDSEVAEATAAITNIKNLSLTAEQIPQQGFATPDIGQVYEAYQVALKKQHKMDYDDQVGYALRILKACPDLLEYYRTTYPYICVDEAQDTSKAQHELLKLLVGERGNIFMVGDEDQSIYRFRGAYPQALLDFKDNYPNPSILWMETNYRSTPQIVDAAADFISRNQNRYPKEMTAHRPGGTPITRIELPSRGAQYQHLLKIAEEKPASTAVLYRDNDSAIPLIDLLMKRNIPYRCPKRDFGLFSAKTTRDVVAFMEFLQDQKNVDAFRRICYKGGFYLDKKTVEIACKTVQWKGITFTQALREQAKRFPKIKSSVAAFDSFCRVGQHLKAKTLLRHLDANGYGAYMEKEHMDRNAFELLLELAAEDPPVPVFLKHLDTLRAQLEKGDDSEEGIILTTAHSAKGLEYESVFLMDLYDGRFPGAPLSGISGRKSDMDAGEEERRLFYVAMTRTRDQLTVLTIRGRESTFADIICPLPKPVRPGPSAAPRRAEPTHEEILARRKTAEEEKRRKAEEARIAREKEKVRRYQQGLAEVKDRSFIENEIIRDSFGVRWLKCDHCGEIKQDGEFNILGITRDTPGRGVCTLCARKMT